MHRLAVGALRRRMVSFGALRFAGAGSQVAKRGGEGKQRDDTVARYENGQLVTRSGLVLRQTEQIEEYVFKLVGGYFKTTNKAGLTLESRLADHGIDSLDTVELAMQMEEDLGYAIATENLPIFHKVKHFVNFIAQTEQFKETAGRAPLA